MIIPKTYKQFGRTIKVETVPSDNFIDYNGIVSPDRNLIRLIRGLDRENTEQTFLHESIHLALSLMERRELYQDEQFVNVLAGLIHQMLHTGKGEI